MTAETTAIAVAAQGHTFKARRCPFGVKGLHSEAKGLHFKARGLRFKVKGHHFTMKGLHSKIKGHTFAAKGLRFRAKGHTFRAQGLRFETEVLPCTARRRPAAGKAKTSGIPENPCGKIL
jgi:hypothetical protein